MSASPAAALPDNLTDVREAHRFDEAALASYMKDHVEGFAGPLTVRQFDGGQSNPTFHLTDGRGRQYVMRKKPPGKLLPSAHAVDREFKVISSVSKTDVPVARAYCLCEDASVIGTAFYVMEFLQGRIFRDPLMPECSPTERGAITDHMNDVLARLHKVDYKAVGLGDYGKQGQYFERQIARWTSQYDLAKTEEIPEMERLKVWLPANIPPGSDETTIAHGDYRLENTIVHPTEPRIIAVLDWELSTLGHPLADLSYNCMIYHFGKGYGATNGLAGHDVKALGFPTEQEYLDAYCRRTGRDGIPFWDFYMAFSMFRLAGIAQGVYKRGLDGNSASTTALKFGNRARTLAELAWNLIKHRA